MTTQQIIEKSFDIAWDCPLADFLSYLEDFNLKLVSFTAFGPAGGNPEVTLSGTITDIATFESRGF